MVVEAGVTGASLSCSVYFCMFDVFHNNKLKENNTHIPLLCILY